MSTHKDAIWLGATLWNDESWRGGPVQSEPAKYECLWMTISLFMTSKPRAVVFLPSPSWPRGSFWNTTVVRLGVWSPPLLTGQQLLTVFSICLFCPQPEGPVLLHDSLSLFFFFPSMDSRSYLLKLMGQCRLFNSVTPPLAKQGADNGHCGELTVVIITSWLSDSSY